MGLFGKKRRKDEENTDASKRDDLSYRLVEIEGQIATKKHELETLTLKLDQVKKEYDSAVSDLMSIKKEANEEKNHIVSLERQQKISKEKILDLEKKYEQERAKLQDVAKTRMQLEQIRRDTEHSREEYNDIQQNISDARNKLNEISVRRIEVEDQYQEILEKIDGVGAKVTETTGEKPVRAAAKSQSHMAGEPKNVIEAASAVVASMKSKLSMAQKELDTVRGLLEKEREAHGRTRQELERLKK